MPNDLLISDLLQTIQELTSRVEDLEGKQNDLSSRDNESNGREAVNRGVFSDNQVATNRREVYPFRVSFATGDEADRLVIYLPKGSCYCGGMEVELPEEVDENDILDITEACRLSEKSEDEEIKVYGHVVGDGEVYKLSISDSPDYEDEEGEIISSINFLIASLGASVNLDSKKYQAVHGAIVLASGEESPIPPVDKFEYNIADEASLKANAEVIDDDDDDDDDDETDSEGASTPEEGVGEEGNEGTETGRPYKYWQLKGFGKFTSVTDIAILDPDGKVVGYKIAKEGEFTPSEVLELQVNAEPPGDFSFLVRKGESANYDENSLVYKRIKLILNQLPPEEVQKVIDAMMQDPDFVDKLINNPNFEQAMSDLIAKNGGFACCSFAFDPKGHTIKNGAICIGRQYILVSGMADVVDGEYRVNINLDDSSGAVEIGNGFEVPNKHHTYIPLYVISNGKVSDDYRAAAMSQAWEDYEDSEGNDVDTVKSTE